MENLLKIYRELKPYMNFKNMYNENYIVYEEKKEIYIKYISKSKNIDTNGNFMAGKVIRFKLKDFLIPTRAS